MRISDFWGIMAIALVAALLGGCVVWGTVATAPCEVFRYSTTQSVPARCLAYYTGDGK